MSRRPGFFGAKFGRHRPLVVAFLGRRLLLADQSGDERATGSFGVGAHLDRRVPLERHAMFLFQVADLTWCQIGTVSWSELIADGRDDFASLGRAFVGLASNTSPLAH